MRASAKLRMAGDEIHLRFLNKIYRVPGCCGMLQESCCVHPGLVPPFGHIDKLWHLGALSISERRVKAARRAHWSRRHGGRERLTQVRMAKPRLKSHICLSQASACMGQPLTEFRYVPPSEHEGAYVFLRACPAVRNCKRLIP